VEDEIRGKDEYDYQDEDKSTDIINLWGVMASDGQKLT